MYIHCTMTQSAILAALSLIGAVSMSAAPRPAMATTMVTINENADETLANNRPANINSVPLGNYKSTGETTDADTFTVEMVGGLVTITNFKSDPPGDSSGPDNADRVDIGGTPFNPDVTITIVSTDERGGVPEVPEPGALALMGTGLALLGGIIAWRRHGRHAH